MTNMTRPSAGADCELVPVNLKHMSVSDVQMYESALLNTGSKNRPLVVDGVQMHPDSLAAEFAFAEPVYDPASFMMQYQHSHSLLESVIGVELEGVDYVDLQQIVNINPSDTPFLWENARVFGCSPDWQVLAGRASLRDDVPPRVKNRGLKELGGHIHLTLPNYMLPPVLKVVAGLPIYDGGALVPVIEEFYDRIRHLHAWDHPSEGPWYRKPKVFRPKSYGFEYRSLGASVMHDPRKREALALIAFQFMDDCFSGRVCI
jgi:hypothetical protein